MRNLRAKVVLVGLPSVGKTSLVRRFTTDEFTERHIETIGVRVEKSALTIDDARIELMIWDIAGPDSSNALQSSYLTGASAVLLVADRAVASTVHALQPLIEQCGRAVPAASIVALMNKADLTMAEGLDIPSVTTGCDLVLSTSAKTGEGVREAFDAIGRALLDAQAKQ